jgi:DNA-binding transcriptional LysR family regulator
MTSASTSPDFADLHLLTVLAQTRSYTQTARRLGISKASVSMRIGELERAAGLPLVRRTTRSVGLTDTGQRLVDDTQAAFTHIAQRFGSVRDQAGQPRGLVRVSAPVALGRQHIAPTLADFIRQYPDIRLELELSDRLVNLTQEGFDLAIRHTHAPPDTHVAWVLCETGSLLVASPDYLRRKGEPAHPAELAQHDCLLYLRDTASQSWAFGKLPVPRQPLPPVVVTVQGPLRANNSEVLREAVLCGLGIGLLPDFTAATFVQSGQLVPVLPHWQPKGFFGERLYAIRPWTPQVPRAVQCFVEHLRSVFAQGFPASV